MGSDARARSVPEPPRELTSSAAGWWLYAIAPRLPLWLQVPPAAVMLAAVLALRDSPRRPSADAPSHLRQMARSLGKKPMEEREWRIDYTHPQSATEAYKKLRER